MRKITNIDPLEIIVREEGKDIPPKKRQGTSALSEAGKQIPKEITMAMMESHQYFYILIGCHIIFLYHVELFCLFLLLFPLSAFKFSRHHILILHTLVTDFGFESFHLLISVAHKSKLWWERGFKNERKQDRISSKIPSSSNSLLVFNLPCSTKCRRTL
jgi:hypothetical protein